MGIQVGKNSSSVPSSIGNVSSDLRQEHSDIDVYLDKHGMQKSTSNQRIWASKAMKKEAIDIWREDRKPNANSNPLAIIQQGRQLRPLRQRDRIQTDPEAGQKKPAMPVGDIQALVANSRIIVARQKPAPSVNAMVSVSKPVVEARTFTTHTHIVVSRQPTGLPVGVVAGAPRPTVEAQASTFNPVDSELDTVPLDPDSLEDAEVDDQELGEICNLIGLPTVVAIRRLLAKMPRIMRLSNRS